jgi:hypothetical protein
MEIGALADPQIGIEPARLFNISPLQLLPNVAALPHKPQGELCLPRVAHAFSQEPVEVEEQG